MKLDFEGFKVSMGVVITTSSYIISQITLDQVSKVIAIGVGITAFVYNIFKILSERAKKKHYEELKRKENEGK